MTLRNKKARDLYEHGKGQAGGRLALIAEAADLTFDELQEQLDLAGLQRIPNDDRAENLVTEIFATILEAQQ